MMLMMLFSFEPLIAACLVVPRSNYHHTSKQIKKQKKHCLLIQSVLTSIFLYFK